MEFERENSKLKMILLVLLIFLVMTILITAYFIKKEIGKNADIKNTVNSNKQAPTKVRPLTPEQVEKALSSSSESAENNAKKSLAPITPEQISSTLNRTTDKTSAVSNNTQPLSSEEIEAALRKTK